MQNRISRKQKLAKLRKHFELREALLKREQEKRRRKEKVKKYILYFVATATIVGITVVVCRLVF